MGTLSKLSLWSDRLFLCLVALLPLHTVYLRAGIAWKPWLILLAAVALLDLISRRRLPWSGRAMLGSVVFLAAVLVSWPVADASETFWRLWLALGAGCLTLLVTGLHASRTDSLLKVVFWSAAAMGLTGLVLGLVTNGVFGEHAVTAVNDILGIDRVNKPAYLGSGFVALTNWHQDPGYAALWSNVWFVLSGFALSRGVVKGPRWLGPLVLGAVASTTILTLSRTGWLGLVVAVVVLVLAHVGKGALSVRPVLAVLAGAALVAAGFITALVITDPEGVGGDLSTALDFRFTYLFALGAIDIGEVGVIDPDQIIGDNRLEVWTEYWNRFLDSPIRGIGLGTGWAETGFQEPHNLWLQLAAESGVVGLVGFVTLLGLVYSVSGKPDPMSASVLAVVGFAALTQTVIFEPVLWFGLGLWLAHVENREAETPLSAVP